VRTERPTEVLAERYALLAELGRDGAGARWLAHDAVLERDVEVRILRPPFTDDPELAAHLAEALARATRVTFPGLPRVLDGGLDRGARYLVREHVPGETLRERLDRAGPLAPAQVARIGSELLGALGAAHREGLVHLALAPERVLLGEDGRVRLLDLGIGQAARAAGRPDAASLLAPATEPPEPLAERDHRADVHGTAAVLFEALTGQRPGAERSPRSLRPDVPPPLDLAVRRGLSPDPAERPAATALAETLRDLVETTPAAGSPPEAGVRRVLLGWLLVPALIILGAALTIGFGLWVGRLELGGPLGVRPTREEPSPPRPRARPLPATAVRVVDPYGDGRENDDAAPLAIDGDPATAWRSENYFDGVLHKPGVGLLLDLGRERTVTGFRLQTSHPGYRFGIAVGEDPAALAAAARGTFTARLETASPLPETRGRYVLVWIVSVVDAGDGNRAEIAEIEVLGRG
jgi:serine/threonine-protein kinase